MHFDQHTRARTHTHTHTHTHLAEQINICRTPHSIPQSRVKTFSRLLATWRNVYMGKFIPYSKQQVGAREEQNHTLPVPWWGHCWWLKSPFPWWIFSTLKPSLNNTLTPACHSLLLCEHAVGVEIISLAKTYLGYIPTSNIQVSDQLRLQFIWCQALISHLHYVTSLTSLSSMTGDRGQMSVHTSEVSFHPLGRRDWSVTWRRTGLPCASPRQKYRGTEVPPFPVFPFSAVAKLFKTNTSDFSVLDPGGRICRSLRFPPFPLSSPPPSALHHRLHDNRPQCAPSGMLLFSGEVTSDSLWPCVPQPRNRCF